MTAADRIVFEDDGRTAERVVLRKLDRERRRFPERPGICRPGYLKPPGPRIGSKKLPGCEARGFERRAGIRDDPYGHFITHGPSFVGSESERKRASCPLERRWELALPAALAADHPFVHAFFIR